MFRILFVFSLALSTAWGWSQIPPPLQSQFQGIINYALVNPGVKGISACVIMPDNSVWTGQAGDNGTGVSITDSTVFYGGSTVKTFIATRILQLWEDGLLDLDSAYIKYRDTLGFVLPETTVRQMLNHTSGIYDVDQNPLFIQTIFTDPTHFFTPDEILVNYLNQPHIFPPGTNFEYSNSNYIILGTIIETVTGNSVSEELRNNVYNAVPLHQTYFGAYEAFTEPFCGLWMYINGVLTDLTDIPQISLLSAFYSAGNIVSYPLDEAHFIRSLLNGDILSESALSQMLSMNTFSGDYGLGMIGVEIAQDTMLYGHNGLFGNVTEMFHSPELNLTVVVMQNSENGNSMPFNLLFLSAWDYINTLTEIAENDAGRIHLYPNPAHDILNIRTESGQSKSVEVYTINGDLLVNTQSSDDEVILDIDDFPEGLYVVRVRTDDKSLSYRFIKD